MAGQIEWIALSVFIFFFALVTVMGFLAARWKAGPVSEHLDEWGLVGVVHLVAHRAVGRDGRGNRHDAVARQQPRDVADAPDVRIPVFLAEAQALRKILAHHVAIQHFDFSARLAQTLFNNGRDGALAGAGEPGEPQRETLVCHGMLKKGGGNDSVTRA